MRNALLFGLLLGIFVSSDGLIFPILFPVSIKLTIHRKPLFPPEPAYQVQTIPVYKEVVKKDPSHDKEKLSYGDGYKGSSYGDGYPKIYSNEQHIKQHNYGKGYGSGASKGGNYKAPAAQQGKSFVNIGATFGNNGKGSTYGSGSVSVKGTGYDGDLVSITGTAYAGDLAGDTETGYGDDLGSAKGTSYGTPYSDGHHNKGTTYITTYDDSPKGTPIAGIYGDGAKGSVYSTSYSGDSGHKEGGYAVAYDDPPSAKSVQYTPSYSNKGGAKGSVPYTNYDDGKSVEYSSGYGNEDGSKVQGYSNNYEQADGYNSHEYSPPYSDDGTYVVHYPPPHSSYEERTDNLKFYAGFGSSIYGDSYAKIVYVPRPTQIKVAVTGYKP